MICSVKLFFAGILLLCIEEGVYSQKQKVWIDADTGNETDDMYALVYALNDPAIDVTGISSAHFNNADLVTYKKWNQYKTKGINTVQISQQLNEEVLQTLGKLHVPHPLGADRQMGRAWGGSEPRDSPAARAIIASVKELRKNEKLAIVCLGALTNIASAISLDTSIATHITCYALGAKYDLNKACWNKSEFNIRNDVNAFDYLLDNPSINMVVMPVNIAFPFRYKRDSLYAMLDNGVPVHRMLKKRWEETNPQDTIRTLWDLALMEALLKPGSAVIKSVLAPPENTQRMVSIYVNINVQEMKDDFIRAMHSFATMQR